MELQTLDTYIARRACAAATTQDLAFFAGQTITATEINTLGAENILPDNADGTLKGIFCQFSGLTSATAATNDATARANTDLHHAGLVEFWISDTKIMEAPTFHFTTPGLWFTGAVGTIGTVENMQNSSFMLSFLDHPIHQRARIRARFSTLFATVAPTTSNFISIAFQCVRTRQVA